MSCRLLSRNLRRRAALSVLLTLIALLWCQVWWLIAWCRSSLSRSEVIFKRGGVPVQQSLQHFWHPHPPPTATPKHPRVYFRLLPEGEQLFWVWFLLLFIQALSGRLHEARQTFARQWLALMEVREAKGKWGWRPSKRHQVKSFSKNLGRAVWEEK